MKSLLIKLTLLIGLAHSLTANSSSPLMQAITSKQEQQAERIIRQGAVPTEDEILQAMNANFSAKIIVDMMKKAGLNLNYVFRNGYCLEKYALDTMWDDANNLVYMIQAGVDFHKSAKDEYKDWNCRGSLYSREALKILRAFLNAGYTPDFIMNSSFFWNELPWMDAACWDLLFKHGLNPNKPVYTWHKLNYLIFESIQRKDVTGLRQLIKHGAYVNMIGTNILGENITPLKFALEIINKIEQGEHREWGTHFPLEIIRLLIVNGARL